VGSRQEAEAGSSDVSCTATTLMLLLSTSKSLFMMNTYVVVLLILFVSMLVQATFSFGGALIALPLLAFTIAIKQATPLMTMLSCTIALVIVIKSRRDIHVSNA
jgi:hypothetical protein